MDNRETLTPSSGDAILKRHLFSEVARNWIKGRGHIERAYFVRRPSRQSFGFRVAASSGPIPKAPGSAGGYLPFKNVDLFGAKVAGNISMIGASFDGTLTAGLLQVDGYLFMGSLPEHKASFKKVILAGAKVAGDIYMLGASFDGELDAASLQVGGDLLMRDADYADKVDMF